MKIRVHELAKEFKKDNKEFLEILINMGVEAKSHLSGLNEVEVNKIREALGGKQETIVPKKEEKINKEKEKPVEKKEEPIMKVEKKTGKKKKGRRADFTVKRVEEHVDTVIEEDGIKIIKIKTMLIIEIQ